MSTDTHRSSETSQAGLIDQLQGPAGAAVVFVGGLYPLGLIIVNINLSQYGVANLNSPRRICSRRRAMVLLECARVGGGRLRPGRRRKACFGASVNKHTCSGERAAASP